MTSARNALVQLELRSSGPSCPSSQIALVTLANPPLNLVTRDLLRDLEHVLHGIASSAARTAVIGQGDARVFCAGSDMREFPEMAASPATSKILHENHVIRRLATLTIPTIAAIEGAALGGGLELALACDLRVASRSASLGLPEAAIGGLASNGSQRLTKIVGPARAKHLLLTGEPISAAKAEQWGMITETVTDGSAQERAMEIAGTIALRAPKSIRLSKQLVDLAVDLPLDAGVAAGVAAQEEIFASEDLAEGAAAFAERRAPRFRGY